MRCVREAATLLVAVALLGGCKDDGGDGDDGAVGTTTGDAAESGSGTAAGSDESGSSGSGDEMVDAYPSFAERPCPDDSFLTWENFGAMYMYNYCTGCHASGLPADQRQGAPIETNFDSLDDVRAHAPVIWARSGDQNATMPPVGAASAEERALFGEWLACGAPTDADLGL